MNTRALLFAALGISAACLAAPLIGAAASPAQPPASLRLELFVNDVPASRDFYHDVLGFAVEREDKGYTVVRLGGIQFGLSIAKGLSSKHYFNPELQAQRRGLGAEIVLEIPSVDDALQHVQQHGYKVLTGIQKRPWGARDFRLADPDGYYLRLTSPQ